MHDESVKVIASIFYRCLDCPLCPVTSKSNINGFNVRCLSDSFSSGVRVAIKDC